METIPQPPEGRTLTTAGRADHDARIERARTGRQLPRTLHALCEQAARLTRCGSCGQKPGRACTDVRGVDGFHLARFARARASGLITSAEFASVIADADVFTGSTVVLDGAA